MNIIGKISHKCWMVNSTILVMIAELAANPHSWFFWYEPECPEELLDDE